MPRRYHKRFLTPKEKSIVKMLEFITDYTVGGVSVFMGTSPLPDIVEFADIITRQTPTHEDTQKVSNSRTALKEEILLAKKDKMIDEPIRLCGGLDRIREEFARAEKEEAMCDKNNPYRLNRFEILKCFYRLGTYGEFSSLTAFCNSNGIDIRTAYRRRRDIFLKIARSLLLR